MSKTRLTLIATAWIGATIFLTLFLFLFQIGTADSTVSASSLDKALASAPGIQFTKTVGLSPVGCASTDTINIVGPTTIIYCYSVKNTGDVTFTRNTLIEGGIGPLLNNIYLELSPGEFTYFTVTSFVTQTTVTTASWDAFDITSYTVDDTGPYNFIDISSFGTQIVVGQNGSENVTSPDNFNIQIYDENNHHFRVSMNGVLRISAYDGPIGPNNIPLPITHLKWTLFPFWDDLDNTAGAIYHAMTGTAPSRNWIVQWHNVPHEDNTGNVTFQIVMTEGVGPILFQYEDVDFGVPAWNGGASATIGVQKNGSEHVQYSYNTASITNGMALRFMPVFITATDSHTATVLVSPPPAPAIELTKTAGLSPGVCAGSPTVSLPPGGGTVYYCYEVKNTGNITLSVHTLNDDQIGNIFENMPYDLGPGASLDTVSEGIDISQFITEDTNNTGLWLAYNPGPTNTVTATATATATVDSYNIYLPAIRRDATTTAVPSLLWLAPMTIIIPAVGLQLRRRRNKAGG